MQSFNNQSFTPPNNIVSQAQNQIGGNVENQTNSPSSTVKDKVSGIRSSAKGIINARLELKNLLLSNSLDLLTSSIEFQESGSFIKSSYVVYPQFNNQKEPLLEFLNRYPDLWPLANQAEDNSKQYQSGMNIKMNLG